MGLLSFVTLSTGEKIENPRFLKSRQSELKQAQRRVSRRKKGSARHQKAVTILAHKHLRVKRTRRDFHWKTARTIVDRFNPIYVEELKIVKMVEDGRRRRRSNRGLRRSIYDAAWGMFLQRLSHSASSAGGWVIRVEPAGTSQVCSSCGATVSKAWNIRIHDCPKCGYKADRDVNSAKEILNRGQRLGRSLRGGLRSV